mmetsp:Transcript_1526/g.2921  ORF Transcript_1526/g.2921 Transcript_1526/m.2921 type:complete len:455 (+) Transcript_1526:157-1521(+)
MANWWQSYPNRPLGEKRSSHLVAFGSCSLDDATDSLGNPRAEVKLLGDPDAGAVELSDEEGIHAVGILGTSDEVSSPDKWERLIREVEGSHDVRLVSVESIDEVLELRSIRSVGGVGGSGSEGCRETALSRLLVDKLDRFVEDVEAANLTLNNTRKEALVNNLTVLSDDVLFAELHELFDSLLLLVIVDGLHEVKDGVVRDRSAVLAISTLADPDTLSLGTTVLLHDTRSVLDGFRESLVHFRDLVVRVGIWHTAGKVADGDKRVLGTHAELYIRLSHARDSGLVDVAEQSVKLGIGNSVNNTRVNTDDNTIGLLQKGLDLVVGGIGVEDRNALVSLGNDSVADGDGVGAVSKSIGTLVKTATDLDKVHSSLRVNGLGIELREIPQHILGRSRIANNVEDGWIGDSLVDVDGSGLGLGNVGEGRSTGGGTSSKSRAAGNRGSETGGDAAEHIFC